MFYELLDPSVYNQSNCGTKVTSILTVMVNFNLHNKRLACLSYNRTYIEGFGITDLSELFVVSRVVGYICKRTLLQLHVLKLQLYSPTTIVAVSFKCHSAPLGLQVLQATI
ncbi:hypothetical protein PoB_005086200 [Plakobranchus ocellatus]|uniref:Uncharacterized protein n=1 Tax=Plakobranchus ocellatus TaxID=259542 RepID=A0AAV4BYF5_9GAST|nr:hypothetical protein PoB_005086200 [Plakobranchus ocellatus]